MDELQKYVMEHVERGACTCGRCVDAPANPQDKQPTGHTADLAFFKVKAVNSPNADEFKRLLGLHKGVFGEEVNLLDGKEHNFMEIGGWIGDQSFALMLMGLGELLGVWNLMTPRVLLGDDAPENMVMNLAQRGLVVIMAKAG